MAITLQDLIDRFHLSKDQLDGEFREEHLVKAARIIADHEVLGQQLGLSNDMATINSEKDTQSKGLALLKKWRQRSAWKATYCKLIEALLECGRADCARDVCIELLTQSKYKHRAKNVIMHSQFLSLMIAGGSPMQRNASAEHSAALTTSLPSKHCATSSGETQHGMFTRVVSYSGCSAGTSFPPSHMHKGY